MENNGKKIKSPAPNLSLEFLRELQANFYTSPGGQEYHAGEVDALIAVREDAILNSVQSRNDWDAMEQVYRNERAALFLDRVDTFDMVEQHAVDVLALEDKHARELLKVYQKTALKLRAQLRGRYGSKEARASFSGQQIRVVLAQVEGAIIALQQNLGAEADRASEQMAMESLDQLVSETNAFNSEFSGSLQPINLEAVTAGLDPGNYLVNQYRVSLDTYSNSLRSQIGSGIQQMLVERGTPEAVLDALLDESTIENFFMGEEWRLRRIVRTEMHGMFSQAKLAGIRRLSLGDAPGLMKTLYHPKDHRTGEDSLYAMKLHLVEPVDKPFEYTYTPKKGKPITRIFMQPPDRPNDRSILIPYHPSWK